MISRLTLLMQLTTAPESFTVSTARTAGWSESFWQASAINATDPGINDLCKVRAALLPETAAVIGFRISLYDLDGKTLTPRGSSTGKVFYPGTPNQITDLPQVALEFSGRALGNANSSRFTCRGVPDIFMVGGEYQPSPAYKRKVTEFCAELVDTPYYFMGRDLSQPSARVLSIVNNILTVTNDIGANANDYVIFKRVYTLQGESLRGSYSVETRTDATHYVLRGLPAGTNVGVSGTVRKDVMALQRFGIVQPTRAVVKKVGRPFAAYRGRASKR